MSPPEGSRRIWAVVDPSADPSTPVAAARLIGDGVVALVAGPRSLAEEVSALGVSEVRWLGDPAPPATFEDFAGVVAAGAGGAAPGVVVLPATASGRLLAGRVAARLGTAALTDVTAVGTSGDTLAVTRPFYAGAAVRQEEVLSPVAVLTVSPAMAAEAAASPAAAPVIDVSAAPEGSVGRLVERRPAEARSSALASARVVVGAGRGVGRQEDLALLQELADALGGELACTRPLSEGLGWMGRDRYLGISGRVISPDLYVAVGISGQMQHMVGVAGAKTIVAVNNDPAAPIFKQADYGIVGDLHEVVPVLLKALEQRR